MTKKTSLLIFLGTLILVMGVFALNRSASVSADGNPGATGRGTFDGGKKGGTVTFSFNALVQQDGYVTGEAEIHDLGDDTKVHIEINCISFGGIKKALNSATLGGKIKEATESSLVGSFAVFSVVDNDEGINDPPDSISSLVVSQKECLDCRSFSSLTMSPTVKGNIQVREGGPTCLEGTIYCPTLGTCLGPNEICPIIK